MPYDFAAIETHWQAHWAKNQTFKTPNPGDESFDPEAPSFYVLDMFPYPSGVGLHVGHPLGYIATDIVARHKRMNGFNVLHPMGFDAFGLPAEQFAIEHNVHPRITTEKNIETMVAQLKSLGLGYDWSRRLATTDPGFVKWTQWAFLQMHGSYFDPVRKRAMPIAHLLEKLEGEDYLVGITGELVWSGIDEDMAALSGMPVGTRKWHALSRKEQNQLLDSRRLAFLAEVEVNWCPKLGTVLANEEVKADGRSERGNHPVTKRAMSQWMLRITEYAERLEDGLEGLDWPEPVKQLQRNWIGRSVGAEVDFDVAGPTGDQPAQGERVEKITVFTTRPDTLFGATYMVLAPEHPLVADLTTPEQKPAVEAYIQRCAAMSDEDRQAAAGSKSGIATGGFAVNPVNGEPLPVWIADYVLMGYGTGAIMAVPAHDTRDHAFAVQHDLPIVQVIDGPSSVDTDLEAWTGTGPLTNSANAELDLDGLDQATATEDIVGYLEQEGRGREKVQIRLRDWLFSRQRYWGEPFPILHGPDGEIRAVAEEDLPVELPEMEDFRPAPPEEQNPDAPPAPPLGRAPASWRKVILDGKEYSRELNTMPNWAGSCWYYLRYLSPQDGEHLVNPEAEAYWMGADGVDLYVGGVEHAVLHLLYARFWHQVLFDLGHVRSPEPFQRYFPQGYIQAFYYEDAEGVRVAADAVVDELSGKPAADVQDQDESKLKLAFEGRPVTRRFGKMGKSLKNAVSPDAIIEAYGCDTLRLYEMSMGPLEQSKVWNTADIVGVHRFLNRVWRNLVGEAAEGEPAPAGAPLVSEDEPDTELRKLTARTIDRVSRAMDAMQFNVAVAALIEFNNALVARDTVPHRTATTLVTLLAPLAPHLGEELWSRLGLADGRYATVADAPWPDADPDDLVEDTLELPVQVNGKLRAKIQVPADADRAAVETAARADANVNAHLDGLDVKKVIVVPGKLVNFVVG